MYFVSLARVHIKWSSFFRTEEKDTILIKAVSEDITNQLLESCLDILFEIDIIEEELLKCIKELIETKRCYKIFIFQDIYILKLNQPINCASIQTMVDIYSGK